MNNETKAEHIENNTGLMLDDSNNAYTFPIVYIGEKNKLTVVARTPNDYTVVKCAASHVFIALKDHPVNVEGQYRCPHCLAISYDELDPECDGFD